MIYIDAPRRYIGKRKRYSHLLADTIEELHAFAKSIGLSRCWFHKNHYDVSEDRYVLCNTNGAKLVSPREIARFRTTRVR